MTRDVKRRRPRPYDATRRRELAAESRRSTRSAVIEAAGRLFTANGYAATSVAAIAAEAGVSAQTVYANFETKRRVLQALMDRRVRGEAPAPPFPPPAGDPDPSDPRELLRRLAAGGRRLFERTAPIWPVVREAAESDPLIADWWSGEMDRRLQTARGYVERLPAGTLKPDLTSERATDIFWTVASPETYEALVRRRGWTPEAFEAWIAVAIADLLLENPSPTTSRK